MRPVHEPLPAPTEEGGQNAIRGFNFQHACALQTALRFCEQKIQFCILLEWQDDYVTMDCEKSPDCLHFVQVKSGSALTPYSLYTPKKGQSQSILQKLQAGFSVLPTTKSSVEIHSENGFNFLKQDEANLADISSPTQKDWLQKVNNLNLLMVFASELSAKEQANFWFSKSTLNKITLQAQIESMIAHFCSDNLSTRTIDHITLSRTIIGELVLKASSPEPTTLPIPKSRSFTHIDLYNWIKHAIEFQPTRSWQTIKHYYEDASVPYTRKCQKTHASLFRDTSTTKLNAIHDAQREIAEKLDNSRNFTQSKKEAVQEITSSINIPHLDPIELEILAYHEIENGPELAQLAQADAFFESFEKWQD